MAEHGLDLCVISGFRREVDENCALPKVWILDPWRWNRQVVPKRR